MRVGTFQSRPAARAASGTAKSTSISGLLAAARAILGAFVALASTHTTAAQAAPPSSPPPAAPPSSSKFISAQDGWVDVSEFLDEKYGFLPIVIPITEPAVGAGAAVGALFIDQPLGKAQFKRPNITAVMGLATENGTWGAGAGDFRWWLNDRLQTMAVFFTGSINLDFFGIGNVPALADHPLSYNLEPTIGFLQAKYQLGKSRFYAGLGYAYATVNVHFDAPPETPQLPDFTSTTHLGPLIPSLTYDTRDSLFTPSRGLYVEASLNLFDQALGSDEEFKRAQLIAIYYHPLAEKWFFGVRADLSGTEGSPPFYLQPYITLRGAPAMRYQGETVAQAEAEIRWQCWKRFSLVGFGGYGVARGEFKGIERERAVTTGGAGFRYEMARKYQLHLGIDVAWGPDTTALYVQIGSAWMRP